MSEIYWITRCDAICTTCLVFLIIAGIISTITFIMYLFAIDAEEEKPVAMTKRLMKIFVPTFLISLLVFIFTPTTKEAMAIYGIGSTLDYIKQNPTARQLPDKCINALDKWVDSWNMDEHKKSKKDEDNRAGE